MQFGSEPKKRKEKNVEKGLRNERERDVKKESNGRGK